jgi:hypothetical protein
MIRIELTLEELQAAAKVECEMPVLKNAFIFSALSGLRWSDIEKLVWSEVQHSEQSGYYIRFRQKKTKGAETCPFQNRLFSCWVKEESRMIKYLKDCITVHGIT